VSARSTAAVALASAAVILAARAVSADADAGAAEAEQPLAVVPASTARLKPPTAASFRDAPRVKPTRLGPRAVGCRAHQLGEWIRVRCPGETFALSLVGGDADVAFWIDSSTHEGEVLLPARPGSRHVVQLWKAGKDEAGQFEPQPLIIVQQSTPTNGGPPVLTLY
jgi:hypothetical protein